MGNSTGLLRAARGPFPISSLESYFVPDLGNIMMGRQSDPCPQECRPEWMPSLSDQEIRFAGCLFPQLLDPSMSQRETVGVINLRRTTIPESSTRTWPGALIPGLTIRATDPHHGGSVFSKVKRASKMAPVLEDCLKN